MDGFDRAIARLARSQHGVFSLEQVVRLGGTSDMVYARVSSGRWVQLANGVFRSGGVPPSFRGDLFAATLVTKGSAVSDAAGAALHALTGFGPCRPEVTTSEGRNHRNPLAVVHRRGEYRTTKVDGIRVGTIDQIVGDLAGRVPLPRLERAVDEALLDRRVHLGRIEDLAVRRSQARGRGAGDLRRIVEARADGDPVPESVLEVPFQRLLRSPGIPPVEFQMCVPWTGDRRNRVDAGIPRWRLIAEADGRRWHTRIADFDGDRRSDRLGLTEGWPTVRFTYTDLTGDFEESLRHLRAIGAEREAMLHGVGS